MIGRTIVCATAGMAAVVCSIAVAAAANTAAARPDDAARPAVAGTILGTVWNAQNEPVPGALVRLRNLTTGRVEATARADTAGQFRFENVEGGSYVLEVVNEDGRVVALGQTFSLAPGETVATFVRLGARVKWFGGFFNNAAVAAVASAASVGITAVAIAGQPVSPTR